MRPAPAVISHPDPEDPSRPATAGDAIHLEFVSADPSRAFIAETLMRNMGRGAVAAWAPGDPRRVHPLARQVMEEIGLPVREHAEPSPVAEARPEVVWIRDRGGPRFPEIMAWTFDDPLAAHDAAAALACFRQVRDELKRRIDLFLLVRLRQAAHRAFDEGDTGEHATVGNA